MSFNESRYYGSRVEKTKAERGWLSDEEFYRLGKEEFRDYRRGYGGGASTGIGKWVVIALAVLFLLSFLH